MKINPHTLINSISSSPICPFSTNTATIKKRLMRDKINKLQDKYLFITQI